MDINVSHNWREKKQYKKLNEEVTRIISDFVFFSLRSFVTRHTHEKGVQELRGIRPTSRLQGHDADGDAGDISPVRHTAAVG